MCLTPVALNPGFARGFCISSSSERHSRHHSFYCVIIPFIVSSSLGFSYFLHPKEGNKHRILSKLMHPYFRMGHMLTSILEGMGHSYFPVSGWSKVTPIPT
uniref:Uncharacterized protein n=1 Tax=Arundo donax TaxID=35708 RepID=A0A0A9DHN6_ARUDO